MPSSSCDTLDTPRFTEVTQLLGKKHIFLMAKAKLPVAVCTPGEEHGSGGDSLRGAGLPRHAHAPPALPGGLTRGGASEARGRDEFGSWARPEGRRWGKIRD